MASPKTTTVALVTTMPMKENSTMVGGRPMAWPTIWARWLFAKREKSGMLSESVAQKPTWAVRLAPKTVQKAAEVSNLSGWAKMGPNPSAADQAQPTSATPTRRRKGALRVSSHLIASMPRRMMATLMAQKARKAASCPGEMPRPGIWVAAAGSKEKRMAEMP